MAVKSSKLNSDGDDPLLAGPPAAGWPAWWPAAWWPELATAAACAAWATASEADTDGWWCMFIFHNKKQKNSQDAIAAGPYLNWRDFGAICTIWRLKTRVGAVAGWTPDLTLRHKCATAAHEDYFVRRRTNVRSSRSGEAHRSSNRWMAETADLTSSPKSQHSYHLFSATKEDVATEKKELKRSTFWPEGQAVSYFIVVLLLFLVPKP